MATEHPGKKGTPSAPSPHIKRRLVVNADDFGRTADINAAVLEAHTRGILTTASLMVNEPGLDEAVLLARQHPSLGVGLHLTLLCGRAALPRAEIPDLVDAAGEFRRAPFAVGCRYYFQGRVREQLRREIHAQFARFAATGLPLDHVNGHLHLHLHPVILDLLLQDADRLGVHRMRLTRDPWALGLKLASGRLLYRASHAVVFGLLARRAQFRLAARGILFTTRVFGLLQDSCVDTAYIRALLEQLPPGDSELYSHPSLSDFRHELQGLTDPDVRQIVQTRGIKLIRYQDLQEC